METQDVVLVLAASKSQRKDSLPAPNPGPAELDNVPSVVQSSYVTSPSDQGIPLSSAAPANPAEEKSRKSGSEELVHPSDATSVKDDKTRLKNSQSPCRCSPEVGSPCNGTSAGAAKENHTITVQDTAQQPLSKATAAEGDEHEDDEEAYKTANLKIQQMSGKKFPKVILVEWVAFVCIMGLLITSLTVHKLRDTCIWGLRLWRWCLLVLVIFCGRLVTEWLINIVVCLIEREFLLKKKVLYFVYGLKKGVQAFIWLGLVLLAWALLINHGVKRSRPTKKILNYVTRALASCLIGAAIWLIKTLLIKLLSSSFQCTRFFDRIQESLFHQYIVRTLSGLPLMEMAEMVGRSRSSGQLSFMKYNKEGAKKQAEVIDVEKLHKIKQDKVSAWTMKGLINVISVSGLSTLAESLEQSDDEEAKQQDREITNEWEARAAAYQIFRNVAKPGSKFIEEEDLLRFMKKEDVDNVIPLFPEAVETRKIRRSSLKNWLVNVYLERKSLALSLNDTKTAIDELNNLASAVLLIVIIIIWLLLMGFMTTKVLVFISSQLLLVVFMFGNTAKTVFEAIIFVFVMHPFDVGDRCVIDGVQMVVEEMNILTTIFLRYDGEKIFYPNSVLATKPISNFYRSPEMSDVVEFTVDFSTSVEKIGDLKSRIKTYLESKPKHWRPGHNVVVKEIEDVNKLKLGLYVTHTINFQNYGDKNSRRSELVLQLKKIFEELDIKYRLLPQEVQISYIGSAATNGRL
ncbi:mechanosensitive ion channel protein 10-like [Syzygium oleosum]|uniref:mechanosensitive ion channel protein 10-like n=1 Tax=Syzygium oleosum TaxID=219896 RepID=UPI0024BA106B|nr:mechanosensitive ion channel protein 10-like [Syzygium oleosum]